jgi:hypothetical protein
LEKGARRSASPARGEKEKKTMWSECLLRPLHTRSASLFFVHVPRRGSPVCGCSSHHAHRPPPPWDQRGAARAGRPFLRRAPSQSPVPPFPMRALRTALMVWMLAALAVAGLGERGGEREREGGEQRAGGGRCRWLPRVPANARRRAPSWPPRPPVCRVRSFFDVGLGWPRHGTGGDGRLF